MKNVLPACLVAAALLAVAFRPAETPRVVAVDISRLLSQHKTSLAEQETLQQWIKATQKDLDEQEKTYKGQVAELEQFKPDSDEFRRRAKELNVRKFQLEQEDKSLREEYERKLVRAMAESHGRVKVACQKYADSHDVDCVLQYTSDPVNPNNKNIVAEIIGRTVVAIRKAVDVTDAVLAILDG